MDGLEIYSLIQIILFSRCYLLDSNTTPSNVIKEGLLYRITASPSGTGTDITELGASSNSVGTVFVASSSGTLVV